MYFLWYMLIGLVAGYVASLIVKGNGSGFWLNLIVGIIGGVLGGWLFSLFGLIAVGTLGSLDYLGRRCDRTVADRFGPDPSETGTLLIDVLTHPNRYLRNTDNKLSDIRSSCRVINLSGGSCFCDSASTVRVHGESDRTKQPCPSGVRFSDNSRHFQLRNRS